MATASTAFSSVQQLGLSPEHQSRLNTWIADIALDLKKGVHNYIDAKGELRIGRQGSLSINPDGRWFDYEDFVGGRGAAGLILHLMDATPVDARHHAVQWLSAHPGSGTFAANPISDAEQEAKDRAHAEYAREVLEQRMQPVTPDSATYKYIMNRGLSPVALPPCVMHLERGREHDSAIIGVLTDSAGECVGVQLGHITIDGEKSVYTPQRNHFLLDKEAARDGAFRIPAAPAPDDAVLADITLVVEGLENACAMHEAFPFSAIWGIPGIGRLQHLKLKRGTKLLVLSDGDGEEKQAARSSLTKGIDHLILEGAVVMLATPPLDTDANKLLQQGGVDAIRAVVATAVPAKLSSKGRLAQICRMPWVDFKLAIQALAKELHTNSPFLEAQWKAAHKGDASGQDPGLTLVPEDISWPAPIDDIGGVCDTALTEVQRYIVADPDDLAVLVIYGLLGHFVHHGIIRLTRCPRLELGGEDIDSGKTTALMIVGELLPRPLLIGGSITPPGFYRAVDAGHASVLIDEAESLLKSKDNNTVILMRILRSGSTRKFASVILTEPTSDGRHVARRFSTWAPIAYTVLGQIPDAGMRSRAVAIRLVRALEGEVVTDFDEGDDFPVFIEAKQKFSRWAADQTELPAVPRPPGIFNRRWNNWAPLMRVAALVGGTWPDRVLRAAQRALAAPAPTNSEGAVAILTDIRFLLDTPVHGTLRDQIVAQKLCDEMTTLDEPSAEWRRIYRGQGITPLYLRERLRGLLKPPGVQQWKEAGRNVRGYRRAQFEDAFRRYQIPTVPGEGPASTSTEPPPESPGTPGTPGTGADSSSDIKPVARPGSDSTDPGRDPGRGNGGEPAAPGTGRPGSRPGSAFGDPGRGNPLNTYDKTGGVPGVPGVSGQTPHAQHVFPADADADDDVFRITPTEDER
jgi:Protein of unknown function (DUF3631)